MLATLLKTRQDLGCFTMPDEAHPDTVAHLASQLGLPAPPAWPDEARRTKSLYRYQAAVRAHLSVRPYDEAAERLVTDTTLESRRNDERSRRPHQSRGRSVASGSDRFAGVQHA